MATKNDITGDSIESKATTKQYTENFDNIFPETKTLDDGYGIIMTTCNRRCKLQIEGIGKFSCNRFGCERFKEN